MGFRRRALIERVRDGYRLNLDADERAVLADMVGQLRDLLTRSSADAPQMRRLFPTAYHADPEADAEYQRLMREELVGSHLEAVGTVLNALQSDSRTMTEAELYAMLVSLNSLRLVLGTICDVSENDDDLEITPEHPLFAEYHAYGYLSYVVDAAVDAMSGSL